jgi:hypothetical protein
MPTVSELLAKAAAAEAPPASRSRSSWAQLFAVIDKLVSERGYSAWKATEWLVAEKAIPEDKRRVCYHSYLGYARRKKAAAVAPE